MPTRITAAKLDHAVKALRGVLECQDSAQYLESGAIEEAIRALLQAQVQMWNKASGSMTCPSGSGALSQAHGTP